MQPINSFQKLIVGMAALTIGLRLFFPVTHQSRYGQETDIGTTLLQLTGMLVVFAAAFLLASTARLSLRRSFRMGPGVLGRALVVFAWTGFLVASVIGVRRFGTATSLETVQWQLTGGTLAALVALVWITWLAFYGRGTLPSRRRRYNFGAIALVAVLMTVGYLGQFLYGDASGRADIVLGTQEGQPLSAEEFARVQLLVADMRARGKKYTDLTPKGRDLFNRYLAFLEGRRPAYAPSPSAWQALLQVRTAYPEYNHFDDATLAKRIIAKYPRCRQTFEEVALNSPSGVKTIVARPRTVLLPECLRN